MFSHKPQPQSWKSVILSFIVSLILIFVWIPPTSGTITVISRLTNETLLTVKDAIPIIFLSRDPKLEIEGILVQSNPANACSPVTSPPPFNDFPTNATFYLLAQRNDCENNDKMENAHNAGYDGIIIHNINSNTTDGMGGVDSGATDLIHYAGFVGDYDGHLLMNYSLPDHKGFFIKIHHAKEITTLDLIIALLLGLLLVLVLSIAFAFAFTIACYLIIMVFQGCVIGLNWIIDSILTCWRRRNNEPCRRQYQEWWRRLLPNPETATGAVSDNLTSPFQNHSNKNSSVTCVVCLEDFVQHDRISILPCSHAFHNVCILRWLTQESRVCPLCKKITTEIDTVTYSEESELDTDDDDEAPLFMTPSRNHPRPNQSSPIGTCLFSQHKSSQTPSRQSQSHSLPETTPSVQDCMESSWYTLSGSASVSIVDEVESNIGTNHQSLPSLDQVQGLSKSLPSSSAGYPGRIIPQHLSHSTTGLVHGHSDGSGILDNTDYASISIGQSHPHYLIPEPDDEEMLNCTGEVDAIDQRSDHSCAVDVDNGSDSDHAILT